MAIPKNSLRQAAVVLLSLPREHAAELLDSLEPRQAAVVTAEMAGLRGIASEEREAVARDFAAASAACLGERRSQETTPFRFLHDLQTDALLDLIADEHSQVIALILSHLPPRQAAAALAELAPERLLPIVCRIAAMNEPSPEAVQDVEEELKRRLNSASGCATGSRGVASVVRMLNVMPPATERRLLSTLAEAAPDLLHEVRRAMFGADVAACEDEAVAKAAG